MYCSRLQHTPSNSGVAVQPIVPGPYPCRGRVRCQFIDLIDITPAMESSFIFDAYEWSAFCSSDLIYSCQQHTILSSLLPNEPAQRSI